MLITHYTITKEILCRVADLCWHGAAMQAALSQGAALELLKADAQSRFAKSASRHRLAGDGGLDPHRWAKTVVAVLPATQKSGPPLYPIIDWLRYWHGQLSTLGAVATTPAAPLDGLRTTATAPIGWTRIRSALIVPPPAPEIPGFLGAVDRWLATQTEGRPVGILAAGVLLHNLLHVQPLSSFNELLAHLATVRFLAASDADLNGTLTLTPLFEDLEPLYAQLDRCLWAGDLTAWLETFVSSLEAEAREVAEAAKGYAQLAHAPARGTDRPGLNDRQLQALSLVRESGRVTNRDYRRLFGVSNKTAHQELRALVDRKFLRRVGFGRSVEYVRVSDN